MIPMVGPMAAPAETAVRPGSKVMRDMQAQQQLNRLAFGELGMMLHQVGGRKGLNTEQLDRILFQAAVVRDRDRSANKPALPHHVYIFQQLNKLGEQGEELVRLLLHGIRNKVTRQLKRTPVFPNPVAAPAHKPARLDYEA